MRRWSMFCFITLVLVAAWMIAPLAANAGIQASKHDFTSATSPNAAGLKDSGSDATLCNTCHIPHHSASTRPLWNHTLSTVTYSWTEVTTLAGTTLPTSFPSTGTSKSCLGCHDGSVAVGSVVQGSSWGTTKVTGNAKITGTGGDLTGNHPVGIPYPDQAGATYNSIVTKATVSEYKASPTSARIYGSTAGAKGIECGSCHDPHSTAVGDFLRAAQSTLCVDCHSK